MIPTGETGAIPQRFILYFHSLLNENIDKIYTRVIPTGKTGAIPQRLNFIFSFKKTKIYRP